MRRVSVALGKTPSKGLHFKRGSVSLKVLSQSRNEGKRESAEVSTWTAARQGGKGRILAGPVRS